ncbi:hypothetical protein A374_07261 [Fictibacillus macauensis ZFHKF-1]|uniref:Regulatory protein YycH domain-containing protein n=1 Tax=Fictibacillus macauensis ZFHKF-1 TaxID=1196324 RepID=I8UGS2_9BACL|nr:two-component system activity regulator YycH [Fictibacillus macauensis]EIT86100.1 hypothetical protein A374_07261 [Fictibacillus macauensis ZFHKF-1]
MKWRNRFHQLKRHAKRVSRHYEVIKSVFLVVLIVLSLFLTWSLWTLKPDLGSLENTKTLKKEQVTDAKKVSEVIRPIQMMYYNKTSYLGVPANDKFTKQVKDMLENAKFYDTRTKSTKNLEETLVNREHIEIIYPEEMSSEVYSQIFNVASSGGTFTIPSADRVIFYKNASNDVEAYIVSYGTEKMIAASTTLSFDSLKRLVNQQEKSLVEYEPYVVQKQDDKGSHGSKRFYFPSHAFKLNVYNYLARSISEDTIDRYKNALFRDPSNVKSSNDYYTDEISAMNIYNGNRFKYTNFSQERTEDFSQQSKGPLLSSVEYVNSHAGWGMPYYYSGNEEASSTTTFVPFIRGLPILNSEMKMKLVWNNNDLSEYQRSMVELNTDAKDVGFTTKKVELESGEQVKQALKSYDSSQIHGIMIGYEMKVTKNQYNLYVLEPKWFINAGQNHEWHPLFRDEPRPGGDR